MGLFYLIKVFINMELGQLFEDIMNEPVFDYSVDEDRVTISIMKNRKVIGKVVLELVFDAYSEFEDMVHDPENDFNESDYDKIFPNDRFTKVEYLDVIDNEKGNGYAKQLMGKAISYAKKEGETVMYLNASPMGFNGLNISDLVGFYTSFGFQPIIDSGHNVEMFLNI